MVTLEKTAVPVHTLTDAELERMMIVWDAEWFECHSKNDLDGIQQAESFQRIYYQEWLRRNYY